VDLRAADQAHRRGTAQWIKSILAPSLDSIDGLHWEFHVAQANTASAY